ncbi:MAG: hypothetical protein IT203_07115, partial [Fimbriimonadaceae bacterium]|nr:hypothetical protein [Fimbriimonadaceae bacterium]
FDLQKARAAAASVLAEHMQRKPGAKAGDAGGKFALAYHGSPHKFDKFDISKIGTGEGAQAYGHGLYLAENPKVATGYRKALSNPNLRDDILDIDIPDATTDTQKWALNAFNDEAESAYGEASIDELKTRAITHLRNSYADNNKLLEAANYLKRIKPYSGHLYTVDLPDEAIDRMLDWDKPLSEQPESVRKAIEPLLTGNFAKSDPKGHEIYDALREMYMRPANNGRFASWGPEYAQAVPSSEGASEGLRQLGIPGIKYLDQGSRASGQGTRNFVVFDDKLVTIIDRNGEKLTGQAKQEAIQELQDQHPQTTKAETEGGKFSLSDQTQTPAFERWFGDSKVVDAQGMPLRVYHSGMFDENEDGVPIIGDEGFHFGTITAAESRDLGKRVDDFIKDLKISQSENENGDMRWYWESEGTDSYDFDPEGYDTADDAREAGERFAVEQDFQDTEPMPITEAFLSIQNPKRVPDQHGDWKATVAKAKAQGYDGLVYRNQYEDKGSDSWVAFYPTQIKSATGNTGAFDPKNPDIRFSLEERVGAARGISAAKQQQLVQGLPAGQPVTWTYDTSRWEGWRGKLRKTREYTQDKLLSVLYAQEDIEKVRGDLEDDANVHRRENLMHGRVGARIDLLEKTQTRPLWNAIRKAGLTPELVEDYLEARHAGERNAHVAKINPDMPDGGSGLTNAEAQAFLTGKDKGLRSGKKLNPVTEAKLEAIAKRIDAITQQTRNILVSSGLITQEQKDAMEAAYKTYVPLRGKDGVDVGFQRRATGKGIDVRGKPVQRALGRGEGNRAQNILAEIIGDAERVIVQAEKARVGRTAVKLALENPNPDLWEVEPVEVEQKFSEATEQVYWGVRNLMNDPETLIVPFQGKKYSLYLKDPQIRDALKNLAVDQLPQYLRWFSALNRYFSAIYTRFAPEFVTTNMMRDANLGLIGLSSEKGTKIAAKVAASYASAWQGLWREARGKQMQGKWQKAAREFEEAGGKTYFSRYENVEDIQRRIASEFRGFWELAKEGKLGTAVSKAVGDNHLVKAIGDLNDVVENTLRLAAYQALREEGVSIEKAAKYAKDLTVNFNKRGSATSVLNSFYLFFNASVQGITRTVKLMKQPKVQATLGTLAGLQFMLALMAMGVEDDDGEPLWNKIPEWEKQRNLIFPYITEKDGKKSVTTFKIPMPYGFNLFPYIGGRMAQLFSDVSNDRDVKASDIVNDIGAAVGQSLTPIPIHEGWQAFLPELLKIANSLSSNKDDLGIPITSERPYSKYDIPRSSLGRESTPEAFKAISKALNRLGGGDDYSPPKVLKSLLDWSPEDLQFLFETFTGGIGTTGRRTVGLVENVIADLEVGPKDVPVLRSLVSNIDTKRATANLYYERADMIERDLARVRDAAKDGDETPLDAAKDPAIAEGFKVIVK